MKLFTLPTRRVNKLFLYVGVFGIVFQLTAVIYSLIQGVEMQMAWLLMLVAPLLCIASGTVRALQLQKEPN